LARRRRPEVRRRLARGRTRSEARFPVPPTRAALPKGYAETLATIKSRIQDERVRVVLAANARMVLLYWDIGRVILDRQEHAGWGAKVVDRLAADLREAFPELRGFSPRNLKYMRAFAAAWPRRAIVQEPLAQLPWYHQIALLEKLDDPDGRLWYARQTVEQGWSHNILLLQIQARARARRGKAITNFAATLPPPESDLATHVFKDPYLFDFLGTADPRREREVEQALVDHIQRFLLELGSGFAFVGRQVPLEVGDRDFVVDLLFYHLTLRCFVVIELKAVPFDPAFVGQLNLYLSAADDLLRHPEGVVDIFAAAGLDKPDISIFSDEFLAEVRGMPQRNLAVELLQKLLKGELATRRRKNVVQARSFAEMLEQTVRRYQNRAIEAAQVIEELIARQGHARGQRPR
jgi:predicted nuclease of restriction endonuclease-like (RecB) superfamily